MVSLLVYNQSIPQIDAAACGWVMISASHAAKLLGASERMARLRLMARIGDGCVYSPIVNRWYLHPDVFDELFKEKK